MIDSEDRMDFDIRLGIFDIGLVGFFDAGRLEKADNIVLFKRSAGVGERLGSTALFGSGVIRMDLAFPFDNEESNNKPTFSMTFGQVFSF